MSNAPVVPSEKHKFTQLVFSTYDVQTRSSTLKATYWLLMISIGAAFVGGYIGSQSADLAHFFASTIGVIAGILILNAIPAIALAAVQRPQYGIAVLEM